MSRSIFITLVILCGIFILTQPVNAADWVLSSNIKDYRFFVDSSDISVNNRTVEYWLKVEVPDPVKHGGAQYSVYKMEYDCKRNLARQKNTVIYYENGRIERYENGPWKPVDPFSPMSYALGAAMYINLEKQNWIPITDGKYICNPIKDGSRFEFWEKTVTNGVPFITLAGYDPVNNKSGIIFFFGPTKNKEFYYNFIYSNSVKEIEPGTEADTYYKKVLDVILRKQL